MISSTLASSTTEDDLSTAPLLGPSRPSADLEAMQQGRENGRVTWAQVNRLP